MLQRLLPSLILSANFFTVYPSFAQSPPAYPIHHFVYFELDRPRIHGPAFLNDTVLEGAQLKYTWRELEPERDKYDFHSIREDLAFLNAHHKKLFIQLQDTTFAPEYACIPGYLRTDPAFHGGVNPQYDIPGDDESKAKVEGWVARRWDPAVRTRFALLLNALGKEFDGKIEGINLPETAVDFGESGRLYPPGFTPPVYRDAIIANMIALKHAFPHSVTMQYANFMPGEWLPYTNHHYLSSVYERARALGIGVGGPDLLPFRKGQLAHSYPLIAASHGIIPTGVAAQEGNYSDKNPKTHTKITVSEQLTFAQNYLKVKYIFWFPEEPYFTKEVLPVLHESSNPSSK